MKCVYCMIMLPADKVCNGEGTLTLTPQCLRVLHESFERILSQLDNRGVNGALPMSLNEFAGYRELSFMYDIVRVASSLKVSRHGVPCLWNCILFFEFPCHNSDAHNSDGNFSDAHCSNAHYSYWALRHRRPTPRTMLLKDVCLSVRQFVCHTGILSKLYH